MKVKILRLGHRKKRDKRLTTHVALIARAFGADEVIICGERDDSLIKTVKDVVKRWGGPFEISYSKNWKKTLNDLADNYTIVHLTMYGMPFEKALNKLKGKNLVVIVGSEKVPSDVYKLADYNLSVTNQPHSEAGALAVFLYELFSGKKKRFKDYKIKIKPSKRGKKVIKK